MKKIFSMMTVFTVLLCFWASASELETLVNSGLENVMTKQKRRTKSGKRILQEKLDRCREIDDAVPLLMRDKDHAKAEKLLKEALKLTVEYYGLDDLAVVERCASLGILYMDAGAPLKAEEAFSLGISIGENITGKNNYKLMNLYKFLAVAYYQQSKYEEAISQAKVFESLCVSKFGEASKEAKDAKAFVKELGVRS